jgi:RNA polymerase primary sigma factor
MLSREEEAELARRSRAGDDAARHRLVSANLRFVVSVARRYRHSGVPLADLVNEGNLGLLRAAERFDETHGVRFVSYAIWWIRQGMRQAIARDAELNGDLAVRRLSLDEPLGGETTAALQELVPDDRSEAPEERVLRAGMRHAVDSSLTDLPEREQLVLRLYYGLDGAPPSTLEEVGEHLGVTRERVRQIKERALSRMRAGAGRHGLAVYRGNPLL